MKNILLLITLGFFSCEASSAISSSGHTVVQLGGYATIQGSSQRINIDGLVGDRYDVDGGNRSNGLVGIGYFFNGPVREFAQFFYGINFFYLPKTSVTGTITQELLFTDLAYAYGVTYFPLYVAAQLDLGAPSRRYGVTVNAGVGPDFITTSNYREHALTSTALPNSGFSGKSNTAFTAMVGIDLKRKSTFGNAPMSCGYRFFYLGQGEFLKRTNQVLNNLKSSDKYANAILCTLAV